MFNSDRVLVPEVVEAGFGHQLTDSLEYAWERDESAVELRNGVPGSEAAARSRKVAITEGNFLGGGRSLRVNEGSL